MAGDERTRHCAKCRLNVFNIKELTEVEVRALFLKAEGRVCGRVFRRRDGTVITMDCPTGLAAVRRKAIIGVAMAMTVVLAVIGFRAKSSCPTPSPTGDQGWFDRVVGARMYEARETLRGTTTFGPLIDELYPIRETAGDMAVMP